MRILMLTSGVSLMDGINRHITNIAPALNAMDDVEVAVVAAQPKGELCELLERKGVRVYSLGCPHGHAPLLLPRFCKVMREFKPDVVHVHVLPLMARIALSIWFRRVKLVRTIHGVTTALDLGKGVAVSIKSRLEPFLAKLFKLKFDAACYISNGVRSALNGDGAVIYNPVEFSVASVRGEGLRKELKLDLDTPIIGTACRIARQKNPMAFVKVMCRVVAKMPRAHAVIIGEGDEDLMCTMREIVNTAGVCDRFHWLGYRKNAPNILAEFSVFIMTSFWEGLPTTLLEAMASKTPIAFLRGEGGLRDLDEINHKEGPIAVVADTADELVDEIVALLEDGHGMQIMAERAYEVGRRHFEVDVVVDKLKKFYMGVMTR